MEYGLGCAGCGGSCSGAGLGAVCGYDDYGIPTQCGELAGQSTDVGALSTGYSWNDVWKQGASIGFNIANARYGGVQPGQYMQSGSNIAYRLPAGSTQFGFSNFPGTTGIGSGSLLTYVGIGLVGLFALKAFAGK